MSEDSTLFERIIGHLPYDFNVTQDRDLAQPKDIFFSVHLCGCILQAVIALCCFRWRSALLYCSVIRAHPQKNYVYLTLKTLTESAEPMYTTCTTLWQRKSSHTKVLEKKIRVPISKARFSSPLLCSLYIFLQRIFSLLL